MPAATVVKPFAPQRGDTKARMRRCLKEDPFKEGALEEFCEETSMHGFKFLLPRYLPFVRRVFWFIVLLAFAIITIYQLVIQIQGFLANPLTVNIEKTYPTELNFPVILLCNTMPFRVSRVHPKSDMHDALSAMYKNPKLNVTAAEDYKDVLKTISNTSEYLAQVATHKSDMIVRCMWQSTEECSHEDFVPFFVDNRICYGFNTAREGRKLKTVSQAGESNGLELTLNAETYEEMHGPYTTFGILVGLGDQGETPSSSNTIYTMIGASTKIGIKREEVEYYKGLTCDEKPLKYFTTYSRQACITEKKIDLVVTSCKCFPFVVEEKYIAENGTLKRCNLFQHFQCSSKSLEEIPKFDKSECPQECRTVTFNPTVSQSVIAWSRTGAQYTTSVELTENLINATETKYRYNPQKKQTYLTNVNNLRLQTKDVLDMMDEVNNLTNFNEDGPLKLDPELSTLQISESIDDFEKEVAQEDGGLLSILHNNLKGLNSTIISLRDVITNATLSSYLFGKREVGDKTMHKSTLPTQLFVISEGLIYLQLFNEWSHSLLGLLSQTTGENDRISTTDNDLSKFSDTNIPAWMKIMSHNETLEIFEIKNAVETVTFERNITGKSNMGDQKACLDKEYIRFTHSDGQVKTYSSIEVLTCVLYYWSGPAVKQTNSENLPWFLSFMEPEMQEIDAQTKECTRLLCLVVQGQDIPDCQLDELKFKSRIIQLVDDIDPLIEDCSEIVEDTTYFVSQFLMIYRNTTMKEFYALESNMENYRKNLDEMADILTESIWPIDEELYRIIGNITMYQDEKANMTTLADLFTKRWKNWESDELTLSANTAKESLQQLVDLHEEIDALTTEFNQYFNTSKEAAQDVSFTPGMFKTLSSVHLWANDSESRLQQVLETTKQIANLSKGYIEDITRVKSAYSNGFQTLLQHAEGFESQLVMDDSFFNANFLVVHIFFNEVSIDLTKQERSYTFWSMMSDLGGTCGLWLGFSITTGVEMLSLVFRYFIYPFIRWVVDILDGDLDLLTDKDEKERRRRKRELENSTKQGVDNNGMEMGNGENFELKD